MRISDVHSMLISTYIEWSGFLANPRFVRRGNEITWADRSGAFLPDLVSSVDMLALAENKQYTFQTLDNGSIIQFYYEFDNSGDDVKSASLAYYGAPTTYSEESYESEAGEDPVESLQIKEQPFVSWLRFDFSPTTARGVLHHECHLHLSGFQNSRLMVRRLPTPKQFVEFVIATCHPEQYKTHRLGPSGDYRDLTKIRSVNEEVFACEDHALYNYLIHVATPGL
jgi:hypothetical protein